MIRKLLKWIRVTQEIDNTTILNGRKRIGRGYNKAYRLNPYNPLSYLTIIIVLIVGILMFGFVGVWNELPTTNPFKWQ